MMAGNVSKALDIVRPSRTGRSSENGTSAIGCVRKKVRRMVAVENESGRK
jgi:hypothetical protein